MKQVSIVGFPRIGANRELKKLTEGYFRNEVSREELLLKSAALRKEQWLMQKSAGIDYMPSNDFSFYDTFLDMAALLNIIPERYRALELDPIDTYFAMAKGYQGEKGDVHALPMKKWFNTNYHYIVPELEKDTEIKLAGTKPFLMYKEAKADGVETKPVMVGPYTFIKFLDNNSGLSDSETAAKLVAVYKEIFAEFAKLGISLVQIDEPCLVLDMTDGDKKLFSSIYNELLTAKGSVKVLLQTYFGDVRDIYEDIVKMDFDAIGLDFVEGPKNLELIKKYGFPCDKTLFAGVVNGKNIWINNYELTIKLLANITAATKAPVVISTSCSLLHVPYTVEAETALDKKYLANFAFAKEKLVELRKIALLSESGDYKNECAFKNNAEILKNKAADAFSFADIREKVNGLKDSDFIRKPSFDERRKIQKKELNLPLLPTTTIGSFPQTAEVRKLRRNLKSGAVTKEQYAAEIKKRIEGVIRFQEKIGLDVLVHGEFERNDMVEYFGEKLDGFVFTKNAWVQSYGTRCVKPPVIFGDVKRSKPMTVDIIKYAQSLTDKPVKGMLTGPVTILNWSFPREDISRRDITMQIAVAIKGEVEDLEAAGIKVIQIDEAALREKLPLRKSERHSEYLDWAIPAFRLCHSGVKPETQIHTHMCYSEFGDIIKDIDDMDADVITFEAAKSDLSLLDVLKENNFKTEVGPGIYDIHSPRVPSVDELTEIITKLTQKLDVTKLWVNPDCGLKTRGEAETNESLKNLVAAAKKVRKAL